MSAYTRRYRPSLACLVGLAIAAATGMQVWALDPTLPPGGNFDLSHWYLGLPVDEHDGPLGDSHSIPAVDLVAGYEHPLFFYTDTDGSMVFWAPVWGATTSGSSYPRSELREQIIPGDNYSNWSGYGIHVLEGECKVTQLPSSGNVIIGQIHSKTGLARPLVKIYYDGNLGRVRVAVKQDADDPENNFSDTYYFPYMGLNETINYNIKMHDGFLTMTVNGQVQTRDVFEVSPSWVNEEFYFKAGNYCQDNTGDFNEGSRVAFYSLSTIHASSTNDLTVASPYGTPNPAVGTSGYAYNTLINAVCPGSPVVMGTTNYVLTGWTGTGDVIAGSGTSTSFNLTQDSTLTWLWQTQYWLDTVASSNGSVDIADAWFDAGSNVTITAIPDSGYEFLNWSGDSNSTNAVLNLTMNAAKSVTANFIISGPDLTVISPYGNPIPAVGIHRYEENTLINASVPDPTIIVINNILRQKLTGWTGTGDVIAGSGTNTSFTLTQDSTLEWLWNNQFWLNTEVSGNGSIDVGDAWLNAGSNVTLTATPDAGHHFVGWSGASSSTNPVLNLIMAGPKSVTATFAVDVTTDVYIASPEFVGGGVQFTVSSSDSGLSYQLQYTDSLTTTNGPTPIMWENMGSAVIGDGGDIILTDPGPITTNRFYRLYIHP